MCILGGKNMGNFIKICYFFFDYFLKFSEEDKGRLSGYSKGCGVRARPGVCHDELSSAPGQDSSIIFSGDY